MPQRKPSRPGSSPRLVGRATGCFDNDLCVRRDLFEDAVTICELSTDEAPSARGGVLSLGDRSMDVTPVINWLSPFAESRGFTYYIHHHDNIVIEVARFEPFDRKVFGRMLRLFRTRPAAEGGANVLGVVDRDQCWLLVLDSSNQGEFRFEFLGPAVMCNALRACLGRGTLDTTRP